MLESTLQEINSSLKEIVKALGELGKIAKEPLEIDMSAVADEAINATEEKIQPPQQQFTPVPQTPAQVNAQVPQTPAQVNAQVPQTQIQPAIPTTPVAESFTQEQLAVAMSNAVAAGKMAVIQGVLQNFGVQALTQINPADYNKVATMLKEAGVQV